MTPQQTASKPTASKPSGSGDSKGPARPVSAGRLVRNLLLWLLPVALVWMALTPSYNLFLTTAGENLLHLLESPDVTDLVTTESHFATVLRRDFTAERSAVHRVRVTDVHFPLVLLGALFLAVPGISWRRRLENLGWALLISVFFHISLVVLHVKFAYATQLGAWSLEHYGPLAREVWGMAKHLADLPLKLAWPLVLWTAFYLRLLLPARASS